ncbi:MAG: major royal jelly family protein [Alteromonadaceae bacterium]|nr:major royal jelly family protein [Alteromonadaceae bacterium]
MRFTLGLLLSSTLVLTAGCGSGEDAIAGAAGQPNDFAGNKNPVDDFSSGSTGDSSNTGGLASNEVRVTMEVPGGVTSDGEPTRRNLRIVQPDRVSVYYTNPALQNLGEPSISSRTDSEGFTIIEFTEGLPLGPDVIIDASYGNTRMRALAADADRDVKVNPFSEYLVRNTLSSYTAGEFQTILDCVADEGGELCLNKYVWSTLADQVHDFEIEIPPNVGLGGALDILEDRGDFARYVSAMADYAVLDETSSGKISASSADYNSVFLGIELGQTFLESTLSGSGQWGVRTAQEEILTDDNGTGYVYPALTLTSFDAFNIRVTSLANDIPYDREALIHQAGNDFFVRGSEYWERNTHSSSPGAATLLEDTRLLAGRALYQSITGRGSSKIIGWTRNPYYLDAFTSAPEDETTGPDRVISGYFSAGKAIELEADGDQLRRLGTLEDQYLSVLEVNLLRKEGFDADSLNGRDYNMLYLGTRFSDETTPLTIEAGVGQWQISGGTVNQSQSFTSLQRDSSGAVTTDSTGTRTESWTLSNRTSRLSNGDVDIGRLNLDITTASGDFQRPDIGVGASTPDGTLMAFNLDDGPLGDGILIAAEQTANTAPAAGQFRLQGVALALTSQTNRLRHFDNALLTIESSSSATLSPTSLTSTHSVDDETVTEPALESLADIDLALSQLGDGRVEFTAGNLVLEGFHTASQDQFYLRFRTTGGGEEQIGLLVATRLP